jgi:phosphohistidine swiveling domain-containing protein
MGETKASRLCKLAEAGFGQFILPQAVVTFSEFVTNPDLVHSSTIESFGATTFAVRSSARDEDQSDSNAGKYLSMLDVSSEDLLSAISSVFNSYSDVTELDEVLVQPFIRKSVCSGVVFTADPNLGSRFWTINWTNGSDTTEVTSGANNGEMIVSYAGLEVPSSDLGSLRLEELLQIVREIELYGGMDPIDVEWLQTESSTYIVQVRPLVVPKQKIPEGLVSAELMALKNRILSLQQRHPYLAGDTTMFGIMPDWNPAELIGIRPNTLAFSLFKELISDSIWAYERGNLGYRNLRSFPLVLDFAGHPYVDVRISFNSLIPASLSEVVADKLVNYYLRKLHKNPELHDKVEFEIVLSCFTFDWKAHDLELSEAFESHERLEIRESLIQLTRNAIRGKPYGLETVLQKQASLYERYNSIKSANLEPHVEAFWLIEDCKRYGTLPFAGIARLAFIATQLLESLVHAKIVTDLELLAFTSSLQTRTSQMLADQKSMSADEFLATYGHLRPGTFDITSPNYSQAFDSYFPNFGSRENSEAPNHEEVLLDSFVGKVLTFLPESELEVDGEEFLRFCSRAIVTREESKFQFSRHVSEILEAVARFATALGFSRNDASHIRAQTIQDAYRNTGDFRDNVARDIALGIEREALSHSVTLPVLIREAEEVSCFLASNVGANYITLLAVSEEVAYLNSPNQQIAGKIVLIESADPGYDWIFTRGIAGLVTAWGGANSHMAIRAKELMIPSAIGVGETLFQRLKSSAVSIHLDCRNRRLEILS